jgi:hypothetical protein
MAKATPESDRKANERLPGQNTGPGSPSDRGDNRARNPVRQEDRPHDSRQKLPIDSDSAFGQESG